MKAELIKFLLERTELIHYYKGGESDIVVAFKDSVLDEWSEVEHENFIFNLVKETTIGYLQSEIDRLKTELSEMKKEREELRNKVIEEVMAICEKAGGTISAHYLEKALRIKK